jgi:hypothetical protein
MSGKIQTRQSEHKLTVGSCEILWRREQNPKYHVRRTRIYVSGSGAFDVLEDLQDRTRRPYRAWRPLVLDVLERLGYEDLTLRWSQRAGCGCGCSPGFIIEGGARYGLSDGDLWFKFTDPDVPVVDESLPARTVSVNGPIITITENGENS